MGGPDFNGFSAFLARHAQVVELSLSAVRGSSPRDAGTAMWVARDGLWGTIGGGQLEYMAIDAARAMLRRGDQDTTLEIPLGPEIGQCCGGRVTLRLREMTAAARRAASDRMRRAEAALPHVYVLGAGHVGRALAELLQHMPVKCVLIDERADELARCRAGVETRQSALPESDIARAPAGSAFVVLTHDHGLDFLLTSAALARGDAAYVGMIGSRTKRARLHAWCRENCAGLSLAALTCPIGAGGSRDKQPSVIAAQVLAEVIVALGSRPPSARPPGAPARGTGAHAHADRDVGGDCDAGAGAGVDADAGA